MEKTAIVGGGGELVERLPHALLIEILSRLGVESLCSAAPVCRALRSSVFQVLSTISALDLSGFAPSATILSRILGDNCGLRCLTLDCSRLDDSSVNIIAKEYLQELVLLKCYSFTSYIFLAIAQNCMNLRLLSLELAHGHEPYFAQSCNMKLDKMFKACLLLESLSVKFYLKNCPRSDLASIKFHPPSTIQSLLLQPVTTGQAMDLITSFRLSADLNSSSPIDVGNSLLQPIILMLHSVTLALDNINDKLVTMIINNLNLLTCLCLEDDPPVEPSQYYDFSNIGLQVISSCKNLTHLSLSRSRPHAFKRVTDVGILMLAEGSNGLESVRLGGFSKVTDAGYISILQACRKLKKFEVISGNFLSDLAFHDLASVANSLAKVVLIACNLLTSETPESLSTCKHLEMLDFGGCRSIADRGLNSIAELCKITSLDLSGADITDRGLSSLGRGASRIIILRLRGCKRITDRGFAKLLKKDNTITESLSTLDLGFLPGLSDSTIIRIAEVCKEITNLCIRNCFSITDASVRALGLMEDIYGKRRFVRTLDLYNCFAVSIDSFNLLSIPYFQGLRWLGVGNTGLQLKGRGRIEELLKEREFLKLCLFGCEMGCRDDLVCLVRVLRSRASGPAEMEKKAKCRRRRTGGEASAGPIDGDPFEAGCGVPLPAAPGFASSGMIISRILGDNCGLRSLILDCSRLHDFSVNITAKDHLEELVFLKCYCFTSYIFLAIAQNCTNLRIIVDMRGRFSISVIAGSIEDRRSNSIAKLYNLTSLDLSSTSPRRSTSQITILRLRNCKRLIDWGLAELLKKDNAYH
ncbi:F-box protein [Apostasia shenzhenica]|uniref:F-box protein n=1 Tax=Apostasia shenzhenica TaxID=1088818 RepID=A0A2I0A6Q4_9ASPA|nr:F-box protein [Apostasia shenzhenica]